MTSVNETLIQNLLDLEERCRRDAELLERTLLDGETLYELGNSLAVMITTPEIRMFLELHDPKALQQAREAMGLVERRPFPPTRTEAQIRARLDELADGDSNDEEIDALREIIEQLLVAARVEGHENAGDLQQEGDTIYRTRSGKILTDEDIQALADEAERGYDIKQES